MKTSIIISLLCLSAMGGYAQTNNTTDNAAEKEAVREKAVSVYEKTNGNMGPNAEMQYKSTYANIHALYPDAPANAVPARPSTPYVALQNPPCYKYINKRGLEVMECPGARFMPEGNTEEATARVTTHENSAGTMDVQKENTYLGYYNNIHTLYPQAPANAVPARPSGPYTELQNPPCYKYVNKRGLEVMECPGARFEPEHDNK